ncbi:MULTISPECIES: prephenate dehydratase [unclassified Neptuniibacter]|uniref:prephenate dehydratase n=1 Tax=unclassified Neptuniibacter TaxID=2630693 RepID=UPI000C6B8EF6|nr:MULTISPECIES: prephenate dehydratase [unclassified Neptuniibacter]MAY41065.1 prephenate dehydratase [Oceanospirillaceae bacterium]|tara:strand:+ start:36633 stop:37499 length:867 start_codon:yes stop_codon:yes gene_type:complete
MTDLPAIIAYQGVPGAYSHLSCRKAFPELQAQACHTFADAMFMVDSGKARFAMIPLENSTAGRVEEIYRLMPKTKLHIVGEHFEPVNHCLLALKGSDIAQIKTVASHPQALAQCYDNLNDLSISPIASLDTAGAAAELSENPVQGHGAIASSLAAELYDLEILRENFQDKSGNTTRFMILARDSHMPELRTDTRFMTSIMFTVRNMPAALYKALGGFSTNGVNMLKLESYMASDTMRVSSFHLDVEGHPAQKSMKYALQELDFFAKDVRIMGTYPWHPFRLQDDQIIE